MADSPYADLIGEMAVEEGLPVEAVNAPLPDSNPASVYGPMLDAERTAQKQAVQSSMFVASKVDPDRAAKVLALSKKTRIPPNIVENHYDSIAKSQDAESTNYDSLIDKTPGLATWLENPDNAKIAKDDIPNLSKVEQASKDFSFMSSMHTALDKGLANTLGGISRVPGLAYDVAAYPQNAAAQAGLLPESFKVTSKDLPVDNAVGNFYDKAAIEFTNPDIEASFTEEIGKGNYTQASRAVAAGIVTNAPQMVAMIATAMVAGPGAATAFTVGTSAAQKNEQNLEAGIDPTVSVPNALTTGGLEAIAENLSFGTLGVIQKEAQRVVAKHGMGAARETFTEAFKTIIKTAAGEGTEEAITSMAQDLTDYFTGVNPDALTGIFQRAGDSAAVGFGSGATTTLPAAKATAAKRRSELRNATTARDTYLAMGEGLEASKARARLPEAAKNYLEQVTQGTPLQNIYIPFEAFETYYQTKGENPVAQAQSLGIAEALEEARETGGDIKIPLALMAELVNTEHYKGLQNDIKFSPDALTVNQANAEEKQVSDDVAAQDAESSRLEQEAQAAQQRMAAEENSRLVFDSVSSQLSAIGIPRTEIDKIATVYQARYKARAENRGMGETALGLFQRQNLEFVKPETVEPVAANMAAQTQEQETYEQKALEVEAAGITPEFMDAPTGDANLPALTANVSDVIGGAGLPVVLKKNIIEKVKASRGTMGTKAYLAPEERLRILKDALYRPDLAIQDDPSKPDRWLLVRRAEGTNDLVAVDVVSVNGRIEPVSFYPPGDKELARKIKRAEKNGGRQVELSTRQEDAKSLITNGTNPEGAASLSALQPGSSNIAQGSSAIQPGQTLDMSQEARKARAQEMGFDTSKVYYHGTKSDITAFDPEYRGKANTRKGVKTEEAFYFSMPDDPETASYYAENANFERAQIEAMKANPNIDIDELLALGRPDLKEHPAVKKVSAEYTKVYKKVKKLAEKRGESIYDIPEYEQVRDVLKKSIATERNIKAADANVVPVYLKFKNPYVFNTSIPENMEFLDKLEKESPGEHHHLAALVEWAKAQGYDALIREGSERSIAVFEPEQIRSVNAEFDPSKADSPNILNQSGEATPRGRIRFGDGKNIIEIFKDADRSTVLHESGHLWLNELIVDATTEGVNPSLVKDLDTILEWMGSSVRSKDGRAAVKGAIQTDQHEMFARGFEAYLLEGKAPSPALKKAFAAFKVWLTNIYKTVAGLDVSLTPDVRKVFDRMLVGEAEAKLAEESLNFKPMDPKALGMNDLEAEKYRQKFAAASQATQEKLTAKLLERITLEQSRAYRDEAEAVAEEIRNESAGNPAYQALNLLQTGTDINGVPVKLDRESIVQEYGKEFLNRLPKGVYASEGGTTHQVMGEMLGFESGDQLLTTLANLQPEEDYIAQETDRRMLENYPDLALNQDELRAVAREMAMNEDRAKVTRMEMEYIAKNMLPLLKSAIRNVTKKPPTEAAVRRQAEAMISSKPVSEIAPHRYIAAAAKHQKEAGVFLAKGDFQAMFESKRKQLLNLELHRAATDAKEEIDKHLENFKKFRKTDEQLAKSRDTDIVNAARAVLASFGLGKRDKPASSYLSTLEKYDQATFANLSATVTTLTENAKPYKELTFDEFTDMANQVQAMWNLAKTSREMMVDGVVADRAVALQALNDTLDPLMPNGPRAGSEQEVSDEERRGFALSNLGNSLRRVDAWGRSMDGGNINGAFTKYIVRPVMDATTQYRIKKEETLKTLSEIIQAHVKIDDPKRLYDAPELGYKFTKTELLMALLHTGNNSNKKKLLLAGRGTGRAWGTMNPDGTLDSSKWDAFMMRAQREGIVTKADLDAVQKIWDLNESLKPAAQAAHKKLTGNFFSEITADKFTTQFGEYKGGYMPAISDQTLSVDSKIRNDIGGENTPTNMFPTTDKGFTKARNESYATPLSLDFGKIQSHIDKVLRMSYIQPAVSDVARLTRDRDFRSKLEAFDNDIGGDFIDKWLDRAVRQSSSTPGMSRAWDKIVTGARTKTSGNIMVANVTNSLQNLGGMATAAVRVNPKYLAGAFRRYIFSPKERKESVIAASPYMQTRIGSNAQEFQKGIDDLTMNPSKYEKFVDRFKHYGYLMDRVTNGLVDVVVWEGAYNQALANGLDNRSAMNEADATVKQTLMAGNAEDLAKFETGTPTVRLLTMFSSYFNTQANLLTTEFQIAKREGFNTKAGALRASRAYLFGIAAPAITGAIIYRLMSGKGLDEDDDGEYLDDAFEVFGMSQLKYSLALAPVVGMAGNAIINRFDNKPYNDKVSLSPVVSLIERGAGAPFSAYSAIFDDGSESKAIRDAFFVAGLVTKLPVAPVGKPIGYATDVATGKTETSGPVDYSRGLLTGQGDAKK